MHVDFDSSNPYALGHANEELERLISQARFFGELTEHFLALAGIQPGMHVLDVGCGAGDVSFLAARMVGPTGSVLGIDRSDESVALATTRATAGGLRNVRFLAADAAAFVPDVRVNAVIGRLVLMYFPRPATVLRHLASVIEASGIVAFQEFDLQGAISEPACPTFDIAVQRISTALLRAGANPRMGLALGHVFEEAGLPSPQMRLAARVERGAHSMAYEQVAAITRTLLPAIERMGVASAAEVDIDTLADRMRDETVRLGATLVAPLMIGAWSRSSDRGH